MRVAIAGLGAWGSAAAYYLSKRDADVLGFDLYETPHDQGSTHGGTRGFRELDYRGVDFPALNIRSGQLWDELSAESGIVTLRRNGCLYVARPDHVRIAEGLKAGKQHGLELELLTAADIRVRFPLFSVADDEVGLFEPNAGTSYPEDGVTAHIAGARKAGAEIHFNEPVRSWRRLANGSLEVHTGAGDYTVDRLILAVGSWLSELVDDAPVEVERQVAVWYPRGEDLAAFTDPTLPVFLFDHPNPYNAFYGFPDHRGAGIRVCLHYGGVIAKRLADLSREVTFADLEPVHEAVRLRLPALADLTPVRASTCWYTNTNPSAAPVYPHATDAKVLIATGDAGRGFRIAPAVGEILADVVLDGGSAHIPLVDKTLWKA